jgi:DNA-binding transcriptional ArsR family regulator
MTDLDESAEICAVHEIHGDVVAEVQAKALPERSVERLSRLFSALADPTRLKILHALSVVEELCVCDLAAIADLSVSAVSHQLRLLKDRELVRSRRDGRMVFYRLAEDSARRLLALGMASKN